MDYFKSAYLRLELMFNKFDFKLVYNTNNHRLARFNPEIKLEIMKCFWDLRIHCNEDDRKCG